MGSCGFRSGPFGALSETPEPVKTFAEVAPVQAVNHRVGTIRRLWGLAILAVLGSGCTQLSPQARQSLIDADGLYRSAKYAAAQQALDRWLAENDAAPESAEAYYLRGLSQIKLKNRPAGQADLEHARQKARRPDLKSHASATLGCMAFEDGRYDQAAALLNEAVAGLPARPPLDVVLFRLGTSQQRTGQWAASRKSFSRVASAVPQSPLILPARRKLNWPHEHFAVQCGAFKTAGNATRAVADLRAKGFDASHRVDRRTGGGLYRVYVGQYTTWDQATRAMASVRATGRDAMIVP